MKAHVLCWRPNRIWLIRQFADVNAAYAWAGEANSNPAEFALEVPAAARHVERVLSKAVHPRGQVCPVSGTTELEPVALAVNLPSTG